ncbi:MAG: hypothetical protein AAGD96_06150 [Chloroflexota bacterium]
MQSEIKDSVISDRFKRRNGDRVSIAIVADGGQIPVGGGYIAQIAADGALQYLRTASEEQYPDLVSNAIRSANRLVKAANGGKDGLGCSLAVALIHETKSENRLYIANVGNASVYLVRNQSLIKLTVEHTVDRVGQLDKQMGLFRAELNPDGRALQRSIGIDGHISVDIGFHVTNAITIKSYQKAQLRGAKGLPLNAGDSILVGSDGLMSNAANPNRQLIEEEEIFKTLSSQRGERAARAVVSFALGRDADDNVSVAIMQIPAEEKVIPVAPPVIGFNRQSAFLYAGLAALVVMCYVTVVLVIRGNNQALAASDITPLNLIYPYPIAEDDNSNLVAELSNDLNISNELDVIQETEEPLPMATALPTTTPIPPSPTATAVEEVEQGPIIQPTSTLRPTLEPDPIGIQKYASEPNIRLFYEDQWILAEDDLELHINHEGNELQDASLYIREGSEIEIDQVSETIDFRLFDNSDILIETGQYQAGALIEARTSSGDVVLSVSGSCMAVSYSESQQSLMAACFEGNCNYKIERHSTQQVPIGQWVNLNPADLEAEVTFEPIPSSVALEYQAFLSQFMGGPDDIAACLQPYFPPPATATPWPTATPTSSPTPPPPPPPSNNNNAGSQPSNNQPSNPPSQPSDSSQPAQPTPTSIPPTSTPVHTPPTATPDHSPATSTPDHSQPPVTPDHGTPLPTQAHGQPTQVPNHSTPAPTADHGQSTAVPGHSTPAPTADHSQPTTVPDHSTPAPTADHGQPTTVPDHSTPAPTADHGQPTAVPDHSTPAPTADHGQPTAVPDHSTPAPTADHGQPTPAPDHSTPAPTADHGQPTAVPDHGQPTPAPDHSTPAPTADHGQPTAEPDEG